MSPIWNCLPFSKIVKFFPFLVVRFHVQSLIRLQFIHVYSVDVGCSFIFPSQKITCSNQKYRLIINSCDLFIVKTSILICLIQRNN